MGPCIPPGQILLSSHEAGSALLGVIVYPGATVSLYLLRIKDKLSLAKIRILNTL